MSETEPELGLGLIVEVGDKQLKVLFAAGDTERVYGKNSAPLKRVKFDVGDQIKSRDGQQFVIESLEEIDGLVTYHGDGSSLEESELDDHLAFNNPEEKLFNAQVDSEKFFQLRLKTLELAKKWETSPGKGLFGGRISLIPHQFYIANEVLKRQSPRVLLADEVGLGKTIEACLIIHQQVVTNRAQRVLVVVPDSLVYQWFFELHRKFQLGFAAINQETPPEPGVNPFLQNERVVVSLGLLKGSKIAQEMLREAEFDILVVDEAHQYKREEDGFEYNFLEGLCQRIPSVLLLTATPEQLGMGGHFDRLRLLDPDRYNNFEEFKKEVQGYEAVARAAKELMSEDLSEESLSHLKEWLDEDTLKLGLKDLPNNKKKLIKELIDRHGTGRVFFRNTRQAMRKEYDFFPKRILKDYPLHGHAGGEEFLGFQEKSLWLLDFLRNTSDKVLLICHSKKQIVALEKFIKENDSQIKTALFHSGLSLMARDRQAAYFANESGAQILLCTEIGSEGRNFEFAHHLVLFDLPKKPDLLEQRIGRLDRIGQKADIEIHVPYIKETWEETLYHIYEEGLDSFKKFSSVGTPVFVHFSEEIHEVLEAQKSPSECKDLIKRVQEYRLKLEAQMEESRDLLIEMNSFDPEVGHSLVRTIRESDKGHELKEFMENTFDCFGVDVEDLHQMASYIKPNDNMFIPHFPYLEAEGQTITFDRSEALEREDYQFINWDHPMVREISNLILSESYGNMTVATRKGAGGKKSFVEAFFVTDCPAPDFLDIKRFFPPTLIRVLIDKDGEDFAEKWDKSTLDEKLVAGDREVIERASRLPKKLIKGLIKQAGVLASKKAEGLIEKQTLDLLTSMDEEIARMTALAKVNPSIDEDEVELLRAMKKVMLDHAGQVRLRLEALRVIL